MTKPDTQKGDTSDVRMKGFASRATVSSTLDWIDNAVANLSSEAVSIEAAGGRVLASEFRSPVNVPNFARAMMDGYALKGDETSGATPYNPLRFEVIGESLPGAPFTSRALESGQAIRIMTGAPLPVGADAVLPVERVELEGEFVVAQDDVSPGKHVGKVAEDIAIDDRLLAAGRVLRPQDIGVLSSVGVAEVNVVRAPRVRLVITGNELLPPGSPLEENKIVDSNSPMLAELVRRDGGVVIHPGIIPDDPNQIAKALQDDVDVVLVSGGSSVGQEDHAPRLLARDGELAIHGIAIRPASPAGMGRLGSKFVFLLPGNPVSCLCAYDLFASRAIRQLGGRNKRLPYRRARGKLTRKISSAIGRLDYARVTVTEAGVEPLAISGASVLSSTTRADGFLLIPEDSEGYAANTEVDLYLYD